MCLLLSDIYSGVENPVQIKNDIVVPIDLDRSEAFYIICQNRGDPASDILQSWLLSHHRNQRRHRKSWNSVKIQPPLGCKAYYMINGRIAYRNCTEMIVRPLYNQYMMFFYALNTNWTCDLPLCHMLPDAYMICRLLSSRCLLDKLCNTARAHLNKTFVCSWVVETG